MNTQTLSDFGYRELDLAAQLLRALAENEWNTGADALGDGLRLEFNPHSGAVLLVDEDGQVALLNDAGKLENRLACGGCGAEGFRSQVAFSDDHNLCEECAKNDEKK